MRDEKNVKDAHLKSEATPTPGLKSMPGEITAADKRIGHPTTTETETQTVSAASIPAQVRPTDDTPDPAGFVRSYWLLTCHRGISEYSRAAVANDVRTPVILG